MQYIVSVYMQAADCTIGFFCCTWMLIIYHNTVCLSRYNQPGAHVKLAPGNPVVNKRSRLPYYHYTQFKTIICDFVLAGVMQNDIPNTYTSKKRGNSVLKKP